MPKPTRNLVRSRAGDRPSAVAVEVLLYALGAGFLFYLVDVLAMRWQGLSLH